MCWPAQVVILLTVMISWLEDPDGVKTELQVLEFFSGSARVAQLSEFIGLRSAAFDIDYGKVGEGFKRGKRSSLDLNARAGLVMAIKLILRSKFDEVICMLATCCSSWVPINRGTAQRDICCPLGDENIPSVRRSNKLVSRKLGARSQAS